MNYGNVGTAAVITGVTIYALVSNWKLLWAMGAAMRVACALSVAALLPVWMFFLRLPVVDEVMLWTSGGAYGVAAVLILVAAYPYLTGAKK